MPDLDVAEIAIVNAAETWAIRRQALFDLPEGAEGASRYNDLTIAAAQLHDAVMEKLQGHERAREFGPTPASQDPFYVKELDAIRDRQDAQAEALKRSRGRIREIELALDRVVSFLGPAFKHWEDR